MAGFHIILVPKDASKTKRLFLSSVTARLLAVGAFLVGPLVAGAVYTTLHYQEKFLALKVQMSQENEVLQQKEILASQVKTLELSVSQTQKTVDELKGVLEFETGKMAQGVGPVDEPNQLDGAKTLDVDAAHAEISTLSVEALHQRFHTLDEQISGLNSDVNDILKINLDKITFLNSMPNVVPVDGWVTSGFGFRHNPYSGGYKMHYGLDIASPTGTVIKAPADGKVVMSGARSGYGNQVVIDHGFGVVTMYAHASQLLAKEGQTVKRGDSIAAVGSTGFSTGPHLHYEVHVDGIPTDPLNYVFKQ